MLKEFASSPLALCAAGALIVLYETWRGWRLGLIRQCIKLLAIALALLASFFGGPLLVPLLQPLGYPDQLLSFVGGCLLGVVIFGAISLLSTVVFKKTSQQSFGLIRLAYGGSGALLGAIFGLVLVWFVIVAIRSLGTIAELQGPQAAKSRTGSAYEQGVMEVLVQMKHTLEEGMGETFLEHVDPLPREFYSTLSKLDQLLASEPAFNRLGTYPGVRPLLHHPKVQALQQDPAIMRDLLSRSYARLMGNPRIVELLNDPEIMSLVKKLEFEKALDYALVKPENREPAEHRSEPEHRRAPRAP